MANICFISPHPDDIELFCGGTLLHHITQKDNVTIIMLTKGEQGSYNPLLTGKKLKKIREKEAQERYQQINAALIFADFQDQGVQNSDASILKMQELLHECQPDIIYIPEYQAKESLWRHQDHINGSQITLTAVKQIKEDILVRCYHTKAVTRLINIDPYFHENKQALRIYRSQYSINIFFFLHFMEIYRHRLCKRWGKTLGCQYAEGFREFNYSLNQ